jgi:hypothetical protein
MNHLKRGCQLLAFSLKCEVLKTGQIQFVVIEGPRLAQCSRTAIQFKTTCEIANPPQARTHTHAHTHTHARTHTHFSDYTTRIVLQKWRHPFFTYFFLVMKRNVLGTSRHTGRQVSTALCSSIIGTHNKWSFTRFYVLLFC